MRNKYFMIRHYITPARGERTEAKNYGKDGKKYVDERASFKHRISPNDLSEATYIIDLDSKVVVKNRFRDHLENNVTDSDALDHYLKEYKEEILRENKHYNFALESAEVDK